jgi:hypothetical protein
MGFAFTPCVQVFEQGSALRSYQPRDSGSGDDGNGATAGSGQKQSDADLPEAVQRQLKDLKFEAVTLKKAGDREGAKDKLRQMNELRVRTRRAAATAVADAAKSTNQDAVGSCDIDWESAAGAIDFDSLYKQRTEEKQVVDEFGVDLATVRCVLLWRPAGPKFWPRACSSVNAGLMRYFLLNVCACLSFVRRQLERLEQEALAKVPAAAPTAAKAPAKPRMMF